MLKKIAKKALVILMLISITGNLFTITTSGKGLIKEPVVKVVDSSKLTYKMLTHRAGKNKNIMYIEKIIGHVTDNKKNGKIYNPSVKGNDYISYRGVRGAKKGDIIITYCVYNPYNNYEDDIIERWDFIQ